MAITKSDPRLITDTKKLNRWAAGKKESDLRKQYTELRVIAQKRLKRGGDALRDVEEFAKLGELKNPADLAKEYLRVSKFLRSKKSTASGRKEIARATVKKLREQGIKNVDAENVDKFGEFMNLMMRRYEESTPEGKRLLFDSDKLMNIYDELVERGSITDNSNASSMGRAFNDYLRRTGNSDLIRKAKRKKRRG